MTIGASATTFKLLASVALVGGAASVAALGTYGSFTSTTNASEAVATGRVELKAGGSVHGLDVPATGLVPDDTVQRQLVLTRSEGSEPFGSVTLTTSSQAKNDLTKSTRHGLQLAVDQCPVEWAQVGDTNELACPAAEATSLVAERPVLGRAVGLGSAVTKALNEESTAYLRITLRLPETAGNEFQGLSDTIGFAFVATQRDGEYR